MRVSKTINKGYLDDYINPKRLKVTYSATKLGASGFRAGEFKASGFVLFCFRGFGLGLWGPEFSLGFRVYGLGFRV